MNVWYEKFLESVMCGDEETVEGMLNAGIHPDVFDDDHVTALQLAAAQGNISLSFQSVLMSYRSFHKYILMFIIKFHMQKLLENGANVDKCNDVGMTALMHACRNGHLEAVRLLIEFGCDRFRTTFYGVTALTLAVAGGHIEIVSMLQNAQCLCATQSNAPTPLAAAIAKRHHHIIIFLELICDESKFIDDPCLFGLDAYRIAQILGDKQTCELLSDLGVCSKTPIPINRFISPKTFEPSISYIKCNSVLLPDIRYLIRDEKVHQLDKMLRRKRRFAPLPNGTTSLMFAAVVGNVDTARTLLRNGVDINASLDGFTALMIAIVCGNDAMVNYLLDMGADASSPLELSVAELSAESEGIRASTRQRIEKGSVITHCKREGILTKIMKLLSFGRKKVQAIEYCGGGVRFYGRLAFRERVNCSMGKSTCLVPSKLFQSLVCPDNVEWSDEYDINAVCEKQTDDKYERILDTYTDEDIDRLFRMGNRHTPIPHRILNRPLKHRDKSYAVNAHVNTNTTRLQRMSPLESLTSNNGFGSTYPVWDGSRLSRNISELRANFFNFDSSHQTVNRRHVSFEPKLNHQAMKRTSSEKRNDRYWQSVREKCSLKTYEILKLEEIDESSFALMNSNDFTDIGVSSSDILKLENLRKEFFDLEAY